MVEYEGRVDLRVGRVARRAGQRSSLRSIQVTREAGQLVRVLLQPRVQGGNDGRPIYFDLPSSACVELAFVLLGAAEWPADFAGGSRELTAVCAHLAALDAADVLATACAMVRRASPNTLVEWFGDGIREGLSHRPFDTTVPEAVEEQDARLLAQAAAATYVHGREG